jgi:two-component system sensor histidine kinase VicK
VECLRDDLTSIQNMNSASLQLNLIENSTTLFFIYDLVQKRFNYMNSTCLSFFDLTSTDIEATELLQFVDPDDLQNVVSNINACINGEHIEYIECKLNRGEYYRWLKIRAYRIIENDQRLLAGQAEDITINKENMETIVRHNTKKNSILNILAHDLAGPIGTIANLSSLLAKETSKCESLLIDRYISLISKISQNGIKLIRDFLDQEFLESENVHMIKHRVELVEKISMATEEYFQMQNDLRIQFSCHSNKDPIYVDIDEQKFMQVINNLISNALKFTPDGGNIDLYVKENKEDIIISITDNGIGIPAKYHTTLFDKFSKARRPGLKGEPSTGLGLSIIKTIIEWHGGQIWFDSEENKGTTFYIRLPRA